MAKLETITKIHKTTTETIKKHTGKTWDQWIVILDRAGGEKLKYRDLVIALKKYKLSPWWQAGIPMHYQMYKGVRVEGRNEKGKWATTSTKTYNISQKKMWDFLKSEAGIAVWLKPMSKFEFIKGQNFEVEGGVYGELRTMKAPQRARFKWSDLDWDKHSYVQLIVIKRPKDKCIVGFMHESLSTGRARLQMKEHWLRVLEEIKNATS